jgi:hypothetical protein
LGHKHYEDAALFREFPQLFVSKPTEQIFTRILYLFLKQGVRMRFARHSSPYAQETAVYLPSAAALRAWRRRLTTDLRRASLAAARKWELESLRQVLGNEDRGRVLIALAQVEILDRQWRRIAEYDGVYFVLTKRSIRAVFLEAKRGISRRSRRALNELREKLDTSVGEVDASIYRRGGLAYTELMLQEVREALTADH